MKLPYRQPPSFIEWCILIVGLIGTMVLYTITLHDYAFAKGVQSVSPCRPIKAAYDMDRKQLRRMIRYEQAKGEKL